MSRSSHNKGVTLSPLGHSHAWVEVSCETCGAPIRTQVGRLRQAGRARFCSRSCNPNYKKAEPRSLVVRRSNLKANYGISIEDYDLMVAQQGNKCLICESPPVGQKHAKLYVDHDHKVGFVRGLLCERCNVGIGLFLENPRALRAAARYLELHSGTIINEDIES